MKSNIKKIFANKAVKIICIILAIWLAAVCVCNAVFANVALKQQKGTAVCYEWNENDAFDESEIQTIDMGKDEFKILCLTDIHIRNYASFGASWLGTNFILDGLSRIQLKKLINEQQPDLIVVGGDTVLTAWNDICTQQFCDFMEKFEILWAPVFGNHDYEGRADKAKLAEIYENAEHCLFQSGPSDMGGMGNYVINLTREDEIVYTLFMFDDGQFRVTDGEISDGGINENQIKWFNQNVKGISEKAGKTVPSMAFMHVSVPEYKEQTSDFIAGQRGEDTCSARVNDGFFDEFKAAGGTHMFAGHDHNNNFISQRDGVQLNYMTKSSYNCYFDFDALGGTLIEFDKNNTPTVSIAEF